MTATDTTAPLASGPLFASDPLFASLPPALRAELERSAGRMSVPPGSVLFDEGRACQGFPVVLSGSIRVSKASASGRELVLYRVTPGESCILTTGCLMGDAPYSARGVAETEVAMVLLPRALFERLVTGHEPFRRHVFALFSERLADLMRLVEEVAFRKLDQRLAALLVARAPLVRATHQALADELGSVREIVSRLLRHFADDGLVALGREQVEVRDRAALERLARAL